MQVHQTAKQPLHLFTLKQQHLDCYYIGTVHSFLKDSQNSNTNSLLANSQPQNALPKFNKDNQYFTPSFILSIDKNFYQENWQFEKQKFFDKIQLNQTQISNSMLNMVNPTFNFCQVCKASYDDYLSHINDKIHKKLMNQTTGNEYITDICKSMLHKEKMIKKQQKIKKGKQKGEKLTKIKKKQKSKKDELIMNQNQFKHNLTNTQTNSV